LIWKPLKILGLTLALVLTAADARANPPEEFLAAVARPVWARFVLNQTTEGTEALARLAREGLVLESSENALIRHNLEERMARIGERLRAKRPPESTAPLTQEERILLKAFAAEELRINPRWSALERTEIDFFAPPPEKNFRAQAEEFLAESSPVAAGEKAAAEKPVEGIARMRKYLKEAKACRGNRAPPTTRQNNRWYALRQLGIDEAATAVGKVIAAGSSPVQWKDLPADLAHEALASLGSSAFSMSDGRLQMRWIKVGLFGTAVSGGSAVIYSFSPIKETHAKPESEITLDRLKFDVAWSWADALPQIKLYDLLDGMDCMGESKALVMGLHVGAGLLTNVAYFGLRNVFIK
jgi:hypothetical protein